MVTKLLYLLSAVYLSGCTAGVSSVSMHPRRTFSPCTTARLSQSPPVGEVASIVDDFTLDARRYQVPCYGVREIIISEVTESTLAGYCLPRLVVVLDKTFWDAASSITRRTLVYHELGHCALGLNHGDESDLDDIMNPYVLPDYAAEYNWPKLVHRLFTGEKNEHE